jgi:hypothetical protein
MNLQMWIEQIERRKEALAAADVAADVARNAARAAGQAQIEASALRASAASLEVLDAARAVEKAAKRTYKAACAAEDAALSWCRSARLDLVAAKAAAWDAQAFEAAERAADEAAAQAVVEAAARAVAEFQEQEISDEELERALSGDASFLNVDEDGYPAISGGPIVW